MGDSKLADLLRSGVQVWNKQRPKGSLSLADLDLDRLDLRGADLSHAGMWGCNLYGTDLSDASLEGSDLSWATLCRTRLIRTCVKGASFYGASVYGAAIWDLQGTPSNESYLSIVPDNRWWETDRELFHVEGGLRLAQFLSSTYSALANAEPDPLLSGMIDALSARVALLLGRFTNKEERLKKIASVLRDNHSTAALIFDFSQPRSRDLTEALTTWARLCSFIIADLTDPSSVPHELASTVPFLPSVPVFPIIMSEAKHYAMFEHLSRYPWVQKPISFTSDSDLPFIIAEIVRQRAALPRHAP